MARYHYTRENKNGVVLYLESEPAEDAMDEFDDEIAGVHYPEEWEFGLITGATFFGKRGLVLQHGEDDVSSFTLNPSWLSCEDETQRCIMVEIYLEP